MFAAALSLTMGIFAGAAPVPGAQKGLQIYFIDVEGGQSTLFVTPEGKSLLIDTGWPGNNGRDANRIAAAAKDAGIKKIDFVLITHYHDDHVGGAPQLAARIPVGTFIDHGENRETSDPGASRVFAAYQKLLSSGRYKHITAKPGEVLPITGMQVRVVTADGELIERPLPGGGGKENANCANAPKPPGDVMEKAPGLEDLWQLHYSEESGDTHNVAAPFLANLQGPDAGNYLKVTALADGSFEVFNSRTRETKKYAAKKN